MASSIVHGAHWVVYILSFLSVASLFTRGYRWGSGFLALLFTSQGCFDGCLLTKAENHYRLAEGIPTIHDGMLTERLVSGFLPQMGLSLVIAAVFLLIFAFPSKKR